MFSQEGVWCCASCVGTSGNKVCFHQVNARVLKTKVLPLPVGLTRRKLTKSSFLCARTILLPTFDCHDGGYGVRLNICLLLVAMKRASDSSISLRLDCMMGQFWCLPLKSFWGDGLCIINNGHTVILTMRYCRYCRGACRWSWSGGRGIGIKIVINFVWIGLHGM